MPDDVRSLFQDALFDDSIGDTQTQRMQGRLALSTLIEHDNGDAGDTAPSPTTLALLSAFPGWSAVLDEGQRSTPHKFVQSVDNGGDWLNKTLNYEQRDHLKGAMLDSYYTPISIVDAVWSGMRHMGFEGGTILEGAVGNGRFIGRCGDDGTHYRFHALDIDPVASRMAQVLYPQARVHNIAFEDYLAPENSFDLFVSNVPYGNRTTSDSRYTRNHRSLLIHDYYLLRAMDLVRPGGIVAALTSTGTLDKNNESVREALSEQANLIAAYRLPANTFEGTPVPADLVFFQRRGPDMAQDDRTWVYGGLYSLNTPHDGHQQAHMNDYFRDHPNHVIGDLVAQRNRWGDFEAVPRFNSPEARQEALQNLGGFLTQTLPANQYSAHVSAMISPAEDTPTSGEADRPVHSRLPVGSHVIDHNNRLATLLQPDDVHDNFSADNERIRRTEAVEYSPRKETILRDLLPIRDNLMVLLDTQHETDDAAQLADAQKALTQAYDRFIATHGPLHTLNRHWSQNPVNMEPLSTLILSTEVYDKETETVSKSPVFTERTVGRPDAPQSADSDHDALMMSLNAHGRPLPSYMASLRGDDSSDAVVQRLRDAGAIYINPDTTALEPRDHYLSGNVGRKLSVARIAAEINPDYRTNVEALEAVQPEPLRPSQVSIGMGSSWIPEKIYGQFVSEMAGCPIEEDNVDVTAPYVVTRDAGENTYSVEHRGPGYATGNQSNKLQWSTNRVKFLKVVDRALNSATVNLQTKDPDTGKRVDDPEATQEANTIIERFRERFASWVHEQPNRSEYLTGLYNDHINIWREPAYDGSHLTFPGLSESESLRTHQQDFVWRTIQSGNALAAHVVGGGKTAELIASAMEHKRLGLARKPAFCVPKPVLHQFASQVHRFYPRAHVLMVTNEDLRKDNRERFMTRVATHNWDAVMMTHEMLNRMPLSTVRQKRYLQQELEEARNAAGSVDSRAATRATEDRIKKLETRLKKLVDKQDKDEDTGLTFESLGIDMLLVDESHYFKNLDVVTNRPQVPGVSVRPSARATDLHHKSRYIRELYKDEDRGLIFASGTPVSNTMAEMYNISRYLSPSSLEAVGISDFDSWANLFGRVKSQLERSPDGTGYRMHERFAEFVNIPELAKLFRHVADVKLQGDLNLPVPDHQVKQIGVEPNIMQKAFLASLGYRAEHAGDLYARDNDNILAIATDGRHASLDMASLSPDMPEIPGGKVDESVRTIVAAYNTETDERGEVTPNVQLVFSDLAVPKKDKWSIYEATRDGLVAQGIPKNEIAFIHDAKTDKKQEELFDRVRRGDVRVLFGSTGKMGTGVDVQNYISHVHELDIPWRPADVEQRQGRAVRQGNQLDNVAINKLVTIDSYDEFMAQAVERKANFIAQALTSPDKAQREISEDADPQFADVMAIATGNPLIKEKVDLDARRDEMVMERRMHMDQVRRSRSDLFMGQDQLEREQPRLESLKHDLAQREAAPEAFTFSFNEPVRVDKEGNTANEVTDSLLFGTHVCHIADHLNFRNREKFDLGTYRGMLYRLSSTVGLRGENRVMLQRVGQMTTESPLSDNPKGVAQQVAHLARDMEHQIEKMGTSVARWQKQVDDISNSGNADHTFSRQEELDAVVLRLAEVEDQLISDAREQNGEHSYPPEVMEALASMMDMRDRNGLPLVPTEMLSENERKTFGPRCPIQSVWRQEQQDDPYTVRFATDHSEMATPPAASLLADDADESNLSPNPITGHQALTETTYQDFGARSDASEVEQGGHHVSRSPSME